MQIKQKGFTLVELVVVMAIIAILVALALFAINAARQGGRNTERRADARTVQVVLESSYANSGVTKKYPSCGAGTSAVKVYGLAVGGGCDALQSAINTYASGMMNGAAVKDDPRGATENERLCYKNADEPSTYTLRAKMEPSTGTPTCADTVATGESFSVQ